MDKKLHFVSATAILVKNNKFLITKRSNNLKRWPGRWTVPGGKLEPNDYTSREPDTKEGHWYNVIEQLIKREVKEEVGLEVNKLKYLTSLTFLRDDGYPGLILSFFTKDFKGEIKLNPELIGYKWVTLEEAKNYNLIAGIYEELEMVDKVLREGETREWSGKYEKQ